MRVRRGGGGVRGGGRVLRVLRNLGLVLVVATQRAAKIAEAPAERATDLGKALGPEHQQGNHQDEQQMCGLKDVADHSAENSPWTA